MFKVLADGCSPTRGSKFSACVDLYASEDCVIGAGETKLIGLGVCVDLENFSDNPIFLNSHYLQLNPRSSLRAKGLVSHTGIIDLDYKDEIKIIIHNPVGKFIFSGDIGGNLTEHDREPFKIKKGDKIGQITLMEHKGYLMGIDSEEERVGGFGSTDEKSKL